MLQVEGWGEEPPYSRPNTARTRTEDRRKHGSLRNGEKFLEAGVQDLSTQVVGCTEKRAELERFEASTFHSQHKRPSKVLVRK